MKYKEEKRRRKGKEGNAKEVKGEGKRGRDEREIEEGLGGQQRGRRTKEMRRKNGRKRSDC